MDKLKQMQDIMKLQKTIAEAREAGKDKQIPVEIVEEKKVVNTLPTTYISANQLKLSAKELTHKVSYLDRLRQDDDRYEKLQISEEKAKKIRGKVCIRIGFFARLVYYSLGQKTYIR